MQHKSEDLAALAALVDGGRLTPVVDRVLPFDQARRGRGGERGSEGTRGGGERARGLSLKQASCGVRCKGLSLKQADGYRSRWCKGLSLKQASEMQARI